MLIRALQFSRPLPELPVRLFPPARGVAAIELSREGTPGGLDKLFGRVQMRTGDRGESSSGGSVEPGLGPDAVPFQYVRQHPLLSMVLSGHGVPSSSGLDSETKGVLWVIARTYPAVTERASRRCPSCLRWAGGRQQCRALAGRVGP